MAGERNGIRPGTIGEGEALIAKKLVAEDPGLVAPERRAELMEMVRTIYDRDHAVRVTLSDKDLAACSQPMRMISPRPDRGTSADHGSAHALQQKGRRPKPTPLEATHLGAPYTSVTTKRAPTEADAPVTNGLT